MTRRDWFGAGGTAAGLAATAAVVGPLSWKLLAVVAGIQFVLGTVVHIVSAIRGTP